jgi:hypothetical protein
VGFNSYTSQPRNNDLMTDAGYSAVPLLPLLTIRWGGLLSRPTIVSNDS